MDSRDIFNLTNRTIDWELNWIHIGTGNQVKIYELESQLNKSFKSNKTIFLRRGRRDSEEIEFNKVMEKVLTLIDKENFELWSKDFKTAIQFKDIGVINRSK